jgi:hypothetical protein
MNKLMVAEQIAKEFADRGSKVWTKTDEAGNVKIARVYIGSHSKPSYCEVRDDAVLIGSLSGHEYQAVMEYLNAQGIDNRRF